MGISLRAYAVQMEGIQLQSRAQSEEFQRRIQNVASVMMPHLDQLKADFKSVIDSNRRLESISTFEELIALLVKRNFIDDSDKHTWTKLNPTFHKYAQASFHEEPRQHSSVYNNDNGFSTYPKNMPRAHQHLLTDDVINYLSSRISLSWRIFARGLGLTQRHIDQIEATCDKNYSQCVKEVLQIYEQNQSWMTKSNGNAHEDVMRALKLIKLDYLENEFLKLTGYNQHNPR